MNYLGDTRRVVVDVLALVVAVVALVLSGVAVVYSRRSTVAAERSADASVRSADAAERSAPPAQVAWTITHTGGGMYTLRNVGGSDAYGVSITDYPEFEVTWYGPVDHVPAGSVRVFRVHATFDTGWQVTVGWSDLPDGTAPREVVEVLPPGGPRR